MNKQFDSRRRAAVLLACSSVLISSGLVLNRSGAHGHGLSSSFFGGLLLGVLVAVGIVMVLRALGVGPRGSNCSRRWLGK